MNPFSMMHDKPIVCAVLGASGLVGRIFVHELSKNPYFKLAYVVASSRHKGVSLASLGMESLPQELATLRCMEITDLPSSKECPLVFSALPTKIAKKYEEQLRNKGYCIISNASAFRQDPLIPLFIPGINDEQMYLLQEQRKKFGGWIACQSNCSVAILARALYPLRLLPLKRLHIITMQSLSGAGYQGVDSMEILGNVLLDIPHEAEKFPQELQKIFPALFTHSDHSCIVSARCHRVASERAHVLNVYCEFSQELTRNDLFALWKQSKLIGGATLHLCEKVSHLQPKEFCRKFGPNDVAIGGLERLAPTMFSFIVCGDNLGLGAASGAILSAESLLSLKLFTKS